MAELRPSLPAIKRLFFFILLTRPGLWSGQAGRFCSGNIGEVRKTRGQGRVRHGRRVGHAGHVDGVGEFVDEGEGEEEGGAAFLRQGRLGESVGVEGVKEDGGEVYEGVGAVEGGCGAGVDEGGVLGWKGKELREGGVGWEGRVLGWGETLGVGPAGCEARVGGDGEGDVGR